MKRRSWCTVLPASGATPDATIGFRNSTRRASTSRSLKGDARTLSTRPDFPYVSLLHESVAALGSRGWVALRQPGDRARDRARVPPHIAPVIPLDALQRAAAYTLDKPRLGVAESLAIDGALVLALTLGGGIAAIDALSARL